MKLYKWKPHQPKPNCDALDGSNDTTAPKKKTPKRPSKKKKDNTPWKWTLPKSETKTEIQCNSWSKRQTLLRLYNEHPLATLRVGTLTANVRDVCDDHAQEETTCLREAVRIIANAKQQAQELTGGFIQYVVVKAFEDDQNVPAEDRELLDIICPRLARPGSVDDKGISHNAEVDEDDKSLQYQFLLRLLTHFFSGNVRNDSPVGRQVQKFINRASELKLCEPFSTVPTMNQTIFPSNVLWSSAQDLAKEIKMHYGKGCENIQKQVRSRDHHLLHHEVVLRQLCASLTSRVFYYRNY